MQLTSKETLRALIEQRGLSYAQIGTGADCHRTMISQLVNGHRFSCGEDLAGRIAEVLDVPRDVLFVDKPSASSGRSNKPVQTKRKAAVA